MINRNLFRQLKNEHSEYFSRRQKIIGISNKALNMAKQAIFALHRDEIKQAKKSLREIEKMLVGLRKYFIKNSALKNEGSYKAALEEYVEAKLFWQALKFGRISKITKTQVDFNGYLAGICDLTGELLRKIVLSATDGKIKRAKILKKIIADIMSELIKFNLTGYLRHKYDDAKRNLKRAEEILYEIKIRGKK